MAVASAVLTVAAYPNGVDAQQSCQVLRGTVGGVAGNTYSTNGVPVNFGSLLDGTNGGAFPPPNQTGAVNPYSVGIFSIYSSTTAIAAQSTYTYDPIHKTIRITVAGAELASGATILALDTIGWYAEYPRAL